MSYSLNQQILRAEGPVGDPLTALVKRGVTVQEAGDWVDIDACITLLEGSTAFRLDFSRYGNDREELVYEIAQEMEAIQDLIVILMDTHEFLAKTTKKIAKGKI